jgi:hypothetical protein
MGKIGAGLGTFEMMGKTASFAPLYNSMASIASSLARAKAEAAKQQKKAEEAAQAKIDDFIISDKNQYTQKYLPFAQKAFAELVTNIQEDKVKYPNIWMNRVSTRILEAKDRLNWAIEQSNVQRDIEKKAEEGFMVPGELLQAYKQKPGDISDIQSLSPALNLYGIGVSANGAISHSLSKPLEIGDDYMKFKSTRAIFGAPTTTITAKKSTDGSQYDEVRTEKTIDPASFENYKVEATKNKDIRATFKVRRLNEVSAEFDALRKAPALSQYGDAELFEIATTNAIQKTVDAMPKSDITTSVSREPKGITVNVGKPDYIQPEDVFFTEGNKVTGLQGSVINTFKPGNASYADYENKIKAGGGSFERTEADGTTYVYTKGTDGNINKYKAKTGTVYGFNAETVYKKQGQAPAEVELRTVKSSEVYHPISKAPLGSSEKQDLLKVFNKALVSDYYYIDGKVFASATVEFKKDGPSLSGINSFLIEVKPGDKLDTAGRNLASGDKKKYRSMYDYFKDMAPSSGQSTSGQQTQTGTSAGAPTYAPRSLNP